MIGNGIIKTSIPGFDEILGGGIPVGSIIYISGSPGTGKSILSTQFLIGGINRGEVGLYLTMEEPREKFVSHMERVGWNIRAYEDSNQMIIIDYPPHEVDQLTSPSNPLLEIIKDYNVSRVVIDSILPLAISFDTDYLRKRAFFQLISNISEWETTTFIVGEETSFNPSNGIPVLRYGFETIADGWIHMYYVRKRMERKRYIEVIKLKGMNHSTRLHEFTVSKGISIKP